MVTQRRSYVEVPGVHHALPSRIPPGPFRHPALAIWRDVGGSVPDPGLCLRHRRAMRGAVQGRDPGFIYSRYSNPTISMFERRMIELEGAEAARSAATGMAAVTTAILAPLKAG